MSDSRLVQFEPRSEKTGSSGFPTRSNTNRAVQPQKMARGLKFRIKVEESVYYPYIAKTKALISCAGTAQLICVSVFAYAKSRFSHNEAHFIFIVSCSLGKHKMRLICI